MQTTTRNTPKKTGGYGSSEPIATATGSGICAQDLWYLLESQSFKCALTGRPLSPETASVDHIIPVSKGGENAASNLQIVERKVNSAKGTMLQDEFIQMCRDVVNWIDCRIE